MASSFISPRPTLVPVVCTDLGSWVHGRAGGCPVQALWDAARTRRSTPGITVATETEGGGGRLPSTCPGPGDSVLGQAGWGRGKPLHTPGLTHAAPGVPPRPTPPTDTTEDWGPKLSPWDSLLGLDRASFHHPHFLPLPDPLPPSRTSPTPGVARLQFLEALEPKKLLLTHRFSAGRAGEAVPCLERPLTPRWEAKPGTPFPRRSVGR